MLWESQEERDALPESQMRKVEHQNFHAYLLIYRILFGDHHIDYKLDETLDLLQDMLLLALMRSHQTRDSQLVQQTRKEHMHISWEAYLFLKNGLCDKSQSRPVIVREILNHPWLIGTSDLDFSDRLNAKWLAESPKIS